MAFAAASITARSRTLRLNYKQHPCWNVFTSRSCRRLTSAASPAAISATNPLQQEKDGRSIWLKSLLFATGAISFLMGTKEIDRFVQQCVECGSQLIRMNSEPLEGSQISSTFKEGNLRSLEYRRLRCKGTYDEKNSIYVGPRYLKPYGVMESGYYLITPLLPLPGDPQSLQEPILVNRGWVPISWRDKASLDASESGKRVFMSNTSTAASVQQNSKAYRSPFWHKKKQMEDSVPVTAVAIEFIGVVRNSEKPSIFGRKNDPGSNKWSIIDIQAIALACGLSEKTICVYDMTGNKDLTRPFPYTQNVDEYVKDQMDRLSSVQSPGTYCRTRFSEN